MFMHPCYLIFPAFNIHEITLKITIITSIKLSSMTLMSGIEMYAISFGKFDDKE